MPGRSPAVRWTLRPTPKPLCRQERIWAARSASLRLASSSRRKTLFSQIRRNGSSVRLAGMGWNRPSGVNAPSVTRAGRCHGHEVRFNPDTALLPAEGQTVRSRVR